MAIIELDEMEFYAYHGCFAEETVIGTHFRVNICFELDTQQAELSDNIEHTVSYLDVYQEAKRQMEIPSKLVEHVARRIVDNIMQKFLPIQYIKVKVSKMNPPLGGKLQSVSVSIEKKRT